MELRIKEVCKEKGISFISLSKKLNISRQALDKRIKKNPTSESLTEIADAIGVDVIELIKPSSDYAHFYNNGEWLGIRKK